MADSLNCPNCGAGVAAGASTCAFCGSRLATVGCPSCLGSIFVGSEYCPHCGAKIVAAASVDDSTLPCPGCKAAMRHVMVGQTKMRQCEGCGSAWLAPDDFKALCTDRQALGAVTTSLGLAARGGEPATIGVKPVHYVPCAVCHKTMNRVNFGHTSGVIVDVCKQDGVWFERDELRQVLEFVAKGGLERATETSTARDDARIHALGLDPSLVHDGLSSGAQMERVLVSMSDTNSLVSSFLNALFH